uniref:Uncharacterized protein n=1 Tax=Sphaerodactylus townsendi TaxID=933632 RepID=A0ACB8E857_9SAUR
MQFQWDWLCFSVLLFSAVGAESQASEVEVEDFDKNSENANVDKGAPTLEVVYKTPMPTGEVYFTETFDDGILSGWVLSQTKKEDTDEDIAKYDGKSNCFLIAWQVSRLDWGPTAWRCVWEEVQQKDRPLLCQACLAGGLKRTRSVERQGGTRRSGFEPGCYMSTLTAGSRGECKWSQVAELSLALFVVTVKQPCLPSRYLSLRSSAPLLSAWRLLPSPPSHRRP